MKINKEDLLNNNDCLARKLLREMSEYSEYLQEKADKLEELSNMLWVNIVLGRITDTEVINAARAWYDHSDLTVQEIINMVIGGDDE